jgi:hypothetical protein
MSEKMTCPECGKDISLVKPKPMAIDAIAPDPRRVFRTHGPASRRCPGSGQAPVSAERRRQR